jgi:aminoglycoside phosphotransferase (APT) family kinase protein
MRFVLANTTIPVPRPYETRFSDTGEITGSVMDFMPGNRLDKVWNTLTPDQKVSVCRQLGGYVSQLKGLKGKRIESVDRKSIMVGNRYPRDGGPFETEKDFNDFVAAAVSEPQPQIIKHFARTGLTENHEIHFTHGDISRRNILADEGGNITALLDWEWAGWHPEYWELHKMFWNGAPRGIRDYLDYMQYIRPFTYEPEILAMYYLTCVSGEG